MASPKDIIVTVVVEVGRMGNVDDRWRRRDKVNLKSGTVLRDPCRNRQWGNVAEIDRRASTVEGHRERVTRQVYAQVRLRRVGDHNAVANVKVGNGVAVQLPGRSLENVVSRSAG